MLCVLWRGPGHGGHSVCGQDHQQDRHRGPLRRRHQAHGALRPLQREQMPREVL